MNQLLLNFFLTKLDSASKYLSSEGLYFLFSLIHVSRHFLRFKVPKSLEEGRVALSLEVSLKLRTGIVMTELHHLLLDACSELCGIGRKFGSFCG